MATLSGNKIKDTYQSLIKLTDNGNLTTGAKQLTDGFGNNSPLYISTTQIGIGVTPEATYDLHVYQNAKVGGNLTITGDLTVNGTTTTVDTDTLRVEDPLIEVARNNTSSDAVDIGIYGKYAPSGTTLYAGLFRDTGDDKFKLFKSLEEQPTTTINTSGTGYAKAGLVIGDLESTAGIFSGDVSIPQTNKIRFDGSSGHTYISETADSNLKFFVAGIEQVNITNNLFDINSHIAMNSNNISGGGTFTATTFSGQLDGTISSATTATTQSDGDNSTKVATTAYVDTAIQGHDTLAEVLVGGNTTGGTDIAVTTGDDITFVANSKAIFNSALQIYNTGSQSVIFANTHNLLIDSSTYLTLQANSTIELKPADGENGIRIINDGAVELYHDNSKKFETTSTGINVIGGITGDDSVFIEGNTNPNFTAHDITNETYTSLWSGDTEAALTFNHSLFRITSSAYNFTGTDLFSITNGGTATFSGNVTLGDSNDISMSATSAGQLRILGDAYTGAIALNNDAMHIYHNSSSRDLVFGTNETQAVRIYGANQNVLFYGDISASDVYAGNELKASAVDGAYLLTTDPSTYEVYVDGDLRVNGKIKDSSGDAGSTGQILSSTGSGTNWIDNDTGDIGGSGTANTVTKFTGSGTGVKTIGNGPITFATNDSTFAGTITASGGSTNNDDDANILTLNASEHARLLVDTSSTDGHRATLALESNGNELLLTTTGSASELTSVGALTVTSSATTFTGNVSINTTSSPAKNLVVEGDSSAYATIRVLSNSTAHGAEIEFGDSTDADYGSITQFASSAGEGGRMRFRAGGTETMNLRGGNVGIGTTSPDFTGFGWNVLTVQGGTGAGNAGVLELAAPSTDANGQNLGIVSFNSGSTRNAQIAANRDSANNDGRLSFWTSAGSGGIEERMRIDSSGLVAINTTPQFNRELLVKGEIAAFAQDSGDNQLLMAASSTQTNISATYGSAGSYVPMQFETGGAVRLTLDATGDATFAANIGIGGRTPDSSWGSDSDIIQFGAGDNDEGFIGWRAIAGADELNMGWNCYNDNSNWKYDSANPAGLYQQKNGSHTFYGAASGSADANITWTNQMYIDTGGNVGIGNTSPDALLDISSGTTTDVIRFGADSRWGFSRANSDNRYLSFMRNQNGSGTAVWTVDGDNGNVGIGTTSPSTALHIDQASNDRAGGLYIERNGSNYGLAAFVNSGGYGIIGGGGSYANDVISMDFNNAYVGIGTTSPGYKFQITEAVDRPLSSSQAQMKIEGNGYSAYFALGASSFQIGQNSNYRDMTFHSGASSASILERMRITAGGDVLIGTSTIQGVGGVSIDPNASANPTITTIVSNTSVANAELFVARYNSTQVGAIHLNGTTGTSYATSSDYRLKENVVEMTDALDRVSQLKPSRFNFIAEADRTVDGFLAHEVQDIVPEAITGTKDEVDDEGNPVYQGIDQSKLVPLLVGAIQELKAEIETLKAQIN